MYIPQAELARLEDLVVPGKVVVVYGPRRVGKTTLLKKYLETKNDFLFVYIYNKIYKLLQKFQIFLLFLMQVVSISHQFYQYDSLLNILLIRMPPT